jgi:uncharacterized membrane protein
MRWTDEQVDRWIGGLLRVGVVLAACVVLCAGIWYLVTVGGHGPGYHVFRGEPTQLRTVSGIVKSASAGHPESWIQLGLLLLIATPVARVAFSVFAFGAQRDWTYVTITLIVLGILLYSLSSAGG